MLFLRYITLLGKTDRQKGDGMKTRGTWIAVIVCGASLAAGGLAQAQGSDLPTNATAPAQGTEAIVGAFGLKLGDVFDPSQATSTNTWETVGADGRREYCEYRFAFTNASPEFKEFCVEITPLTHRIYCIIGKIRAERGGNPMPKAEQDSLERALKEKYWSNTVDEKKVPYRYCGLVIDQVTRCISIGNEYRGGEDFYVGGRYFGKQPVLTLTPVEYVDTSLLRLANEEKAQAKFKNKSGL